ncbi:MAG: FG-GAP repeat protein [Verrucomicrobiaceae bacterium]|nr:FG-GAP repeat protein [Verrucomicrobiaceae bacterium]
MKTFLVLFLASTSLLTAGINAPVELVFPAGSSYISPSYQGVAMNDSYILVGFHYADVKDGSGKVVPGAGEVQVFSATTGQFIRRLKHPKPMTGAKFGNRVVLCGNLAAVLDTNLRVNAFDISTGNLKWSYRPTDDTEAFVLHDGFVDHLSADAGGVKLGMSTAWWINYPGLGFYTAQGFVGQVRADGSPTTMLYESDAQAMGGFGGSTAVAGNMTVVGSAQYDVGGEANSGLVTVFDGSTMIGHLNPAVAVAEDQFGCAVAITRDRIVVGARGTDLPGRGNAGRVYVFDKTNFGLVTQIDAPAELGAGARFGETLAGHGSRVLIGGTGSVWSYDLCSGDLLRLTSTGATTTGFGRSVAVCSHSAVVADSDATGGTASQGRVYLYRHLSRTLPAYAVVASTNETAPGCKTGTVFAGFGNTAQATNGKVLHLATLKGGESTSATNAGAWSNQGMDYALVMRKGDEFGSDVLSAPIQPFFANDGTGRFLARYVESQKLAIFRDSGTTVSQLLKEGGSLVVNGKHETIAKIHDVAGSTEASSFVTVAASSLPGSGGVTLSNDSHISRHIGVSMVNEAREGLESAISGVNLGQISPRLAVEAGRLAYVAKLANAPTTADSALFVKSLGINNTRAMAVKGDTAPSAGNAKYSSFVSTAINGTETVFKATLKGGASSITSGLWRTALINNNTQVATYPVAIRLQQAGGMPNGVKYSKFMEIFIASSGGILFRAQVTGPSITPNNDVGIWLHSQGVNHLLLREGAPVQGANGPKVGVIQRVSMAKEGRYAVLVSLSGTPSSANQALLSGNFLSSATSKWAPSLVLQKGQFVDRPTATPIKGLKMSANHIDASGSGSKGQASQVSVHGLLFVTEYASGKDLILANP